MDYAATAFALNILYFTGALSAGWGVLRLLDRMSGIRFTDNFREIRGANTAMALYLGLRFIGVCIFASAFIR